MVKGTLFCLIKILKHFISTESTLSDLYNYIKIKALAAVVPEIMTINMFIKQEQHCMGVKNTNIHTNSVILMFSIYLL